MNTCCPISPVQTPVAPARGFIASLQKLLHTAGFVSVDLTDTIFASPANRDALAAKYVDSPVPQPERPDPARLMSLRLP